MKVVFLCGFMGCGKSTVGLALADRLGVGCADMDSYIEAREAMTIPEIFAEKGEEYFRQRETQAISAMGEQGGVICCGGGAMLRDVNAEAARSCGRVVFIDTPFDVCYQRISGDTNRPIVMANTRESLEGIYEERKPKYSANSHFTVSGLGSPEEIAESIIRRL